LKFIVNHQYFLKYFMKLWLAIRKKSIVDGP